MRSASFPPKWGLNKNLLDEIKRQLGNEDLIFKAMAAALETYKKAYSTIGSFIEKGKRIEDFPFEKFEKR